MKEYAKGFKELKLEPFTLREDADHNKFKIALIGVGQCGNKITTEFIKLNNAGSLINTCPEDIIDAVKRIKDVDKKLYNTVKLEGFDGAAKDRSVGKQAVKSNLAVLQKELLGDKRLIEADYVFVVFGQGGGTGNGGAEDIIKIVSGVMRREKRYKMVVDSRSGKITSMGRPTVGVITASTEADSKHGIQLNSAYSLKELEQLQEKSLLGTILLIDNEKIIEDFLNKDDNETKGTDWVTYGNETTAAILTEIKIITSLPGKETIDKAELLDILTKPGYLTLGKWKIDKKLIEELKNKVKNNEQSIYDYIIKTSFIKQNIFADGYDFNYCMHGGLAVLTHPDSEVIASKQAIMLKKAMNKFLSSPLVETPHFGVYDNEVFGTIENTKVKKDEAIIYTMAVLKKRPKRILEITEKAIDENNRKIQMEKESTNDELDSLLKNINNASSEVQESIAISLEDIFDSDPIIDLDNDLIDNDDNDDPEAALRRALNM